MRVEFLLPSLVAASLVGSFHLPTLGFAWHLSDPQASPTLAQQSSSGRNAYRGSGRREGVALVNRGPELT